MGGRTESVHGPRCSSPFLMVAVTALAICTFSIVGAVPPMVASTSASGAGAALAAATKWVASEQRASLSRGSRSHLRHQNAFVDLEEKDEEEELKVARLVQELEEHDCGVYVDLIRRDGIKLGSGAFATVYYGRRHEDGIPVAIKVFHEADRGDFDKELKIVEELEDEIQQQEEQLSGKELASFQTRCDKVIRLVQKCPDQTALIYHFAGNSLYDASEGMPANPDTEDCAMTALLAQALQGLSCLEQVGLVHRDIKPENMAVAVKTGKLAIIDLGFLVHRLKHFGAGTPPFMAPETLSKEDFVDCRADVYSLGIAMVDIIAGNWPYAFSLNQFGENNELLSVADVRLQWQRGDLKNPASWDPSVWKMIKHFTVAPLLLKMLTFVEDRPFASQLLKEVGSIIRKQRAACGRLGTAVSNWMVSRIGRKQTVSRSRI